MRVYNRKSTLVLLVLLAAAGLSWRQQQAISVARAAKAKAQLELVQLEKEKAAGRELLTALERESANARSERDALLAAATVSSLEMASRNRDAQWTLPPEQWPDWNAASPYVWLPKRALKRIQAPVWDDADRLRDEIVALLGIEPVARDAINSVVRRTMGEWRSSEVAMAVLSPEPLPNLAGEGEAVTVHVPPQPDLAARLRSELRFALRQHLGEQRAGLFEHFASWRLDGEFGLEAHPPAPDQPKIYSVRRSGKLYHVATKGWSGSMGTSGNWRQNIPEHLHPIFEEALKKR